MNYRRLGRTDIQVSEIGFGGWGIGSTGWIGANDDDSLRALNRAIELGLNFIDTALVYGDGHSEQLIGRVVRTHRERIHVATKIPPKNRRWPPGPETRVEEAYPADHVIACTEQSLRNLGRECLDLQQFHVWSDAWVAQGDWLEAINRLKDHGKIRYFGISTNDHQPDDAIDLMATGVVDTVQVIYNVFEQSPEDRLLPMCEQQGVGVIVRVALDEGGLTGTLTPDSQFDADDFRSRYFRDDRKQQVYDRVQEIARDLDISVAQMPATALRFVLSHPAVSTVIPGMRSVRNVERNCRVGDGKGLPREQVTKLKAHRWVRNFYH